MQAIDLIDPYIQTNQKGDIQICKIKFLEILSENWLRTYLIRHHHIEIYETLAKSDSIQKQEPYVKSFID